MGRKGSRTRSGENISGQSWCCIPDENRTGQKSRRLVFAAARLFLGSGRRGALGEEFTARRREQHARERTLPRKLLAQTPRLPQAPRPMNSSGRSQTCVRVLIAAVLFAAFSWTLLVSISPQLHGYIHDDANRTDHVCAVTLIVSGSYKHTNQPPLVSAPQLNIWSASLASLTPAWVSPLFLNAHIFAHAPPAHS